MQGFFNPTVCPRLLSYEKQKKNEYRELYQKFTKDSELSLVVKYK